jgi:hypothetical protein
MYPQPSAAANGIPEILAGFLIQFSFAPSLAAVQQ